MLHAEFVGEEIKASGAIFEGDSYLGFCCDDFDWEVRVIFPDKNPNWNSIWGRCANPNCPNFNQDIGPDDYYRGVGSISQEDFEEWLASRKPNKANRADGTSSASPAR